MCPSGERPGRGGDQEAEGRRGGQGEEGPQGRDGVEGGARREEEGLAGDVMAYSCNPCGESLLQL